MANQPAHASSSDGRLEALMADVIQRRVAGERLGDAQLISQYADLMPELEEWLAKLRLLGRAKKRADDASRIDAGFEESIAPKLLVDGFDILREINRGGQAIVYLARRSDSAELVAIKTLLDGSLADDKARARFEREGRILASLDDPGIVKVTESGVGRTGLQYLVMPYIDGDSLDSRFAKKLAEIDAAWRAEQLRLFVIILRAVGAAHARGIIHRDLKPSNIRIDAAGNPHILDFGLAQRTSTDVQAITQSITISGQFVGSYPWASPEQAGSGDEVTVRSDVYSLGVLLYQLITGGRFPYQVTGPLRDVLNNIIQTQPGMPSAIRPPKAPGVVRTSSIGSISDSRLDAIVLKALAKRPADRYADANAFADDLERYIKGHRIVAREPFRWRRWIAASLVLMGALVATITWNATRPVKLPGPPVGPYGANLIWIPAGKFLMGHPAMSSLKETDSKQHEVTIARGFWMQRYEVTQDEYLAVMGNDPSKFHEAASAPVEMVSWYDAQEYCKRISARDGRSYRLPTEAEWEYACRAGTTTDFNFGNDRMLMIRYGNCADQSNTTNPLLDRQPYKDGMAHTFTVGCLLPNAWGLCDMHGNVWEWCQDNYFADPANPATEAPGRRNVRGGSWWDGANACASAHRSMLEPHFKGDNVGFRVVLDAPAPVEPAAK